MANHPAIVVLSDDADQRSRLVSDLARRLDRDYAVLGIGSADVSELLDRSPEPAGSIAAVISAADLPATGRTGVEVLVALHARHRAVKRILIVERGRWHGHPVRQAMVLGQVDGYLFDPWHPRELWLHLPMAEYLADWSRTQPAELAAITIVGDQWHQRSHELRDIMSRAGIPYAFLSPDSTDGKARLTAAGLDGSSLPVLWHFTGRLLVDPSDHQLVELLGFPAGSGQTYDVAIVGGGPAGLSAAVYAASEGLRVCVIDPSVPGGQAGTSSSIRNYLGFPRGVSGTELTNRAVEQAWLFGTEFLLAREVCGLRSAEAQLMLSTVDGPEIAARSVVLASGISWRTLDVPGIDALVGAGVFYGAAGSEADALRNCTVYVVGGGNSAGQAAVHLARRARQVGVLIRRDSLATTTSDYLIREISAAPNITVHPSTEVAAAGGAGRLEHLVLHDAAGGVDRTVPADALFVMIGGEPRTGWLAGAVALDDRGYVLTGADVPLPHWPLSRLPLYAETSLPGVFAVGDVVHDSTKRVAPSVGSGAVAIAMVHRYLDGLGEALGGAAPPDATAAGSV